MSYCSEQQARDAGASGSSADVLAAIASAQARVDRFTGQIFEPTTLTLVGGIAANGVVLLPRRLRSVTAARLVGSSSDLAPSAYTSSSSSTPGQIDALYLGQGLADPIIAGAEPWNGGWANLIPAAGGQVQVTGSFGWDAPPLEVVKATAMIAAEISNGGGLPAYSPSPRVDSEGNTTAITAELPTAQELLATVRTTGVAAADALLAPLRSPRPRFS